MSSSHRFPLKPTGGKWKITHILKQMEVALGFQAADEEFPPEKHNPVG